MCCTNQSVPDVTVIVTNLYWDNDRDQLLISKLGQRDKQTDRQTDRQTDTQWLNIKLASVLYNEGMDSKTLS